MSRRHTLLLGCAEASARRWLSVQAQPQVKRRWPSRPGPGCLLPWRRAVFSRVSQPSGSGRRCSTANAAVALFNGRIARTRSLISGRRRRRREGRETPERLKPAAGCLLPLPGETPQAQSRRPVGPAAS